MMARVHGKLVGATVLLILPLVGCNVDDRWPIARARHPLVEAETPGSGVDISVVDVGEVDLVEAVVAHRGDYQRSLHELHAYYVAHGYERKAGWAALELEDIRRGKQFKYLLDAEVASNLLKPSDSDPEADALYDKGLSLLRGGGHGVPGLYREDRMVQAAKVFRSLIADHPSSDKIDDAAFFLGEIHKEYLPDQEEIAVRWYERAYNWNPHTLHPARFQAAVVYDYRLHDRDKALELYQGVLEHESGHSSNVRWATRRINELSSDARSTTRQGAP